MQLWCVFLQHDDTGRNSECVVEAADAFVESWPSGTNLLHAGQAMGSRP